MAPEPECAFADGYIFSDVLQAMSAVMGVGGLRYSAIRGRARAGFLTARVRPLDPDFVGTGCRSLEDACFQYMFSSHSLRQRDGIFYDATFAQASEVAEGSVELSRTPTCSGRATFLDSELELDPAGRGYGNWIVWTWGRRELKLTLEIPGRKIAAAGLDAPWQLTLVLYDEQRKAMTGTLVEIEEDWPASSFR